MEESKSEEAVDGTEGDDEGDDSSDVEMRDFQGLLNKGKSTLTLYVQAKEEADRQQERPSLNFGMFSGIKQ